MTVSLLDRATICFDCLDGQASPSSDLLITTKGEVLSIYGLSTLDKTEARTLINDLYRSLDSDDRYFRFNQKLSSDVAVNLGLHDTSIEVPDEAYDIVILNQEGVAVAHGGLVIENGDPELHCIVRYEYRGNKLARRLIEELETAAIAMGYTKLRATTNFENEAISKVLQECGYRRTLQADSYRWEKQIRAQEIGIEICCLNGLGKQSSSCRITEA